MLMKKNVILSLALVCFSSLGLLACSASSSQIITIEQLPKATSPVEDSITGSLSSFSSPKRLASTGLPLGSTDASSFNSSSSLAACEMSNMTQQAIGTTAQADLVLCTIQNTFAAATGASALTNAQGSPIDIYDGNEHTFALDFTGSSLCGDKGNELCTADNENTGPDKIKFRIDRVAGVIRSFEMFACKGGFQEEYLSQTISGTNFIMTAKNTKTRESKTTNQEATVTGTLSVSNPGRFSGSKTILLAMTSTEASDTFWGRFNYEQGSAVGTLAGVMGGSGSYQGAPYNFANQVLGSTQLLDANTEDGVYDLRLLAMGDGSVKACSQGGNTITLASTCPEKSDTYSTWAEAYNESWAADVAGVPALEDASLSEFYTAVASESLPTMGEPTLEAFSGDQAWDCAGTPEATINFLDLGVSFDSCASLQLGHDPIDCWQIAGSGASFNQIPGAFTLNESTIDPTAAGACANNDGFDAPNTGTFAKSAEDENSFTMTDGELTFTGIKNEDGSFTMSSNTYTVDTAVDCTLSMSTTLTGTWGDNFACKPSQTVITGTGSECSGIIGLGNSCTLTYQNTSCTITE